MKSQQRETIAEQNGGLPTEQEQSSDYLHTIESMYQTFVNNQTHKYIEESRETLLKKLMGEDESDTIPALFNNENRKLSQLQNLISKDMLNGKDGYDDSLYQKTTDLADTVDSISNDLLEMNNKIDANKQEILNNVSEYTQKAAETQSGVVSEKSGELWQKLEELDEALRQSTDTSVTNSTELANAVRAEASSIQQGIAELTQSEGKNTDSIQQGIADLTQSVGQNTDSIQQEIAELTGFAHTASEKSARKTEEWGIRLQQESTQLSNQIENAQKDILNRLQEEAASLQSLMDLSEDRSRQEESGRRQNMLEIQAGLERIVSLLLEDRELAENRFRACSQQLSDEMASRGQMLESRLDEMLTDFLKKDDQASSLRKSIADRLRDLSLTSSEKFQTIIQQSSDNAERAGGYSTALTEQQTALMDSLTENQKQLQKENRFMKRLMAVLISLEAVSVIGTIALIVLA